MKKRFIPKKTDSNKEATKYYYIDSQGMISQSSRSHFSDSWDKKRFVWGNCFKTKADAVKARRFLRIKLLNFHKTDL